MYIKKVKLENFRNYDKLDVEFKKDFNLIYGNNAQGKTNILEAIYISAIGKSFQTNKDSELIKMGKEKAKIEAEIENVKKALETNNTDTIKDATEKLTTVFYQMSEQLYKQNAANNATAGATEEAGTESNDGNVYDADYKVEDNGDNK